MASTAIWCAHRRVARDGRAIGGTSPPEDLHALRKRAKKLRYLLEAFGSLFPGAVLSRAVVELKQPSRPPTPCSCRSYPPPSRSGPSTSSWPFIADERLDGVSVLAFFSMVDRRKRLHREVVEQLSSRPDVLGAAIPAATEVEQMGVHRAPVTVFAPRSGAARAYQALWDEVSGRLWPAATRPGPSEPVTP